MKLRGDYTTLSRVRTFLSLASFNTSDDDSLRKMLLWSSRAIDRYTRRYFYPKRHGGNDVLKFDLPESRDTLTFNHHDILEIHGLSDLNGASEIDSSVYWLKCGDEWNITPYDRIVLDDSSGSLFNFSGTDKRAIHVDAVTGYHEDYQSAWIDSGGSLTDALGSAVTLASVSSSAAENSLGISPRFSAGQIWRLGSGSAEEYVYVQDTINASKVRLIRGVNGTSPTAHAASAAINVWQPEWDVEFAATELTSFVYLKSKSPLTNRVVFAEMNAFNNPLTWPEQTLDRLNRFKRDRVHAL